MDRASSPYQYKSKLLELDQHFLKVVLETFSVDFRPTFRLMSRSYLEIEVPNEAIEEVVIPSFCNKAFQHSNGGTENRSKKIR